MYHWYRTMIQNLYLRTDYLCTFVNDFHFRVDCVSFDAIGLSVEQTSW